MTTVLIKQIKTIVRFAPTVHLGKRWICSYFFLTYLYMCLRQERNEFISVKGDFHLNT